ncbi:SDR family NAD(P)-dependent oxidoreductase (plasmid) [Bacillus thuringiensis]|nr:type I polyketide synthase [Bacillus thuringiensis]QFQ28648.1 SDR family NAD(P)-dependent oxidoreductase [Bacillus thuringiensis]
MNIQHVLRALEAGEISPEDAKMKLASLAKSNEKSIVFSETSEEKPDSEDAIAIIGMSGKYPDAPDLVQYWDNLVQGKNSIRVIPPSRWQVEDYYDSRLSQRGKVYCKWIGMLDDIDCFDPLFFNISPAEAEDMDPQQRLFLQEAYHAFEDAGYSREQLSESKCGVYLGIMSNEYGLMLYQNQVSANSTTGNSFAIAAARLPYYLNLKGPAVPVDTACSSSLVAAHIACQALKSGEIDMALVGGVTLYLTPESYISMCGAGMLSPDGQCKTFDNAANGFVPGEGAGALVLKRLKDAEADKDHIYGVIIGSGLNQDGKTNGITAPSTNSQMELERGIYEKYRIDPETIGYVEMHGTGTKLGDPIELEALSTVYREKTDKRNYCAIGSVKSNIGHTSAAAGIASIQKVLLCMDHRKLVPTLNFEKHNEHFDFKQSPFYVNTEVKAWESLNEAPLRAGVSSFGFSGTNAHFVIEQYMGKGAEIRTNADDNDPVLVILSAKSENQLQQYVKNVMEWLKKDRHTSLRNVAFTLQTGRESMDYRLAVKAESKTDLLQKLDAYVNGNDAADIFSGYTKQSRNEVVIYESDVQAIKLLEMWLLNKQLNRIADIWVKGAKVNWNLLYTEDQPYRVSLPTYPFLKNRYWLTKLESLTEVGEAKEEMSIQNFTRILHPLLHLNTSDLFEQRYSSTFSGKEFFLFHHVIGGERILPGAAYLEMALKAAEFAGRLVENSRMSIRLRNVIWERPFIVKNHSVEIHTRVNESQDDGMTIEIYSEADDPDEMPVMYCRARASIEPIRTYPPLDLEATLIRCEDRVLDAEKCYELFESMGIKYGPAHKGIKRLHTCEDEVLAELILPESIWETAEEYTLHPSIVDSALQASIGFILSSGQMIGSDRAIRIMPYGLEELELIRPCIDTNMWSKISYSDNNNSTMDIQIYNSMGEICVSIKGFSVRVVEEADSIKNDLVLLKPVWQETTGLSPVQSVEDDYVVLLCGIEEETFKNSMNMPLERTRYVVIESASFLIDEQFTAYALQVFKEIKRIISSKPVGRVLLQIVVPPQSDGALLAGLLGMLRSAEMENSRMQGQLIQLDTSDEAVIQDKLSENRSLPYSHHIRYQNGKRMTESWVEVDQGALEPCIPWKEKGVYLITGGLGGLGRIFAKEIAHKAQGAVLILTGRSSKTDADDLWLRELEDFNIQVEYRQLDVTDAPVVDDLIHYICERYGSLDGIIHSAGMKRDNYIVHKSSEEFMNVIAPKVSGLVNIDRASKDLPLDFFILFSSLAGSLGNQGQTDYASANGFMDAFSGWRNQLVTSGLRHGYTLAINWPLWQDGGMQVDAETEKMMLRSAGIVPMQTSTGIQALYTAYATGLGQVMVMEGRISQIRERMLQAVHTEVQEPGVLSEHQTDDAQFRNVIGFIEKAVCSILKVKREEIDEHAQLTEYGFDSITFTRLTNELNEHYEIELTPAIFFEYPTMNGLAGYMCKEYAAIDGKTPKREITRNSSVHQNLAPAAKKRQPVKLQRRGPANINFSTNSAHKQKDTIEKEPIAIIGLSGIFPMADDVEAFWGNLVGSKDCISEIPSSRWDWQAYYGNPMTDGNKTKAKWGGFINGIDEFDPLFFGISPKEAELMDPQQRLLMTYVWKAIEDAGYSAQSLSGTNTGIFVGTMNSGYSSLIKEANATIEGYSATGLATSVGPNRMSYFLNVHGPSEPIETACSSSLVAIHRAVRAIQSGDCEMAIAGGINTIVSPELQISFSKAGMLCEDGRCKTFSKEANGYVRGEGVGMLVLKKLSDAEASGDHIYGVIRGTAENHGGRAASLTAPNPKAQADLLLAAYRQAGIDPTTVTYIETHGTGTSLGDPIEINGLKSAFKTLYQDTGEVNQPERRCGLGSVKSNIGHLELAAGVAGVIKVLLQMKHRKLVKSLHCETVNPYIQLKDSPFYIVQEEEEWKALEDKEGNVIPRRAGVSSFGFGGANAHVVIEEYVSQTSELVKDLRAEQPVVIILSARNAERLNEQARLLLEAIQRGSIAESELERVAYTLQVGREAMDERLGFYSYLGARTGE